MSEEYRKLTRKQYDEIHQASAWAFSGPCPEWTDLLICAPAFTHKQEPEQEPAVSEEDPDPQDDRVRGLYNKYQVTRCDGKPLKGGCIVLEWGDPNAREGIQAFADALSTDDRYPTRLTCDLREKLAEWEDMTPFCKLISGNEFVYGDRECLKIRSHLVDYNYVTIADGHLYRMENPAEPVKKLHKTVRPVPMEE